MIPTHPARGRRPALAALLLLASLLFSACGSDEGLRFEDATLGNTQSFPAGLEFDDETVEADYRYTIPAGAGDALDAGTPLEILPERLDVKVGEVIVIVNDDDRGHLVGPFYVGAGETLRQRFATPGEFEGVCTVHPSGQVVVAVSA